MKWIERIEESKNINQLPMYDELIDMAENEDVDLYACWDGKKIIIADGTEIELETSAHLCFADRNNEWIFYHIIDSETYICAECGLWQKSFDEIKKEVGYSDSYGELLLPFNWNEHGIRAYLKRRIEKQQEYEKLRQARMEEWLMDKDCYTCSHMIKCKCEYCNDQDEDFDNACDDYEER